MKDRTPPHSFEAEEALLGAMMSSKEAILAALEVVKPDDFYANANSRIFQVIAELYQRGDTPDPVQVAHELKRKEWLDGIGGTPYLHGLIADFPTVSGAKRYAEIVAEQAQLRALIAAASQVMEMGYSNPIDVAECISEAEAIICSVANEQLRNDPHLPQTVASSLPKILEDLDEDVQAHKEPGFHVGLKSIDEIVGGFQPARQVIVGARPSVGKTSLLIQLSVQAAKQGRNVLFASLEQPRKEVIHRLLSQESDVSVHHLTNPRLMGEAEWVKVVNAAANLPSGRIVVTDGEMDTTTLVSRIRRSISLVGHLDVVVLDYLQLIRSTRTRNWNTTRAEEIGQVSRRLKQLANTLSLTVICAAQLNRESEKNNRRPGLGDLKDSGSIEQDADMVILLHRKDETRGAIVPVELMVKKNRHGPTGSVDAQFIAPMNRFEEV